MPEEIRDNCDDPLLDAVTWIKQGEGNWTFKTWKKAKFFGGGKDGGLIVGMDGEYNNGGSFTVRLDFDDAKKYHVNTIKRGEKVAFLAKVGITISDANNIDRAVKKAQHLTNRIKSVESKGSKDEAALNTALAVWFMNAMLEDSN